MREEDISGTPRDPFLLNTGSVGAPDAARLAAAMEASNDVFFDVDLSDRTIRWSRSVRLVLGHGPQDIGGSLDRWQELIHPDDAERVFASGRTLLPSATGVWSEEFRLRRADGTYAWVRVRSYLVREEGRPAHVVGAIADISDVKGLEDELHELSDELADEIVREREERTRADFLLRAARQEVLGDWDLRTGRITYSPNAEEVLGHPATEIGDMESFMRYADPVEGPRQREDLERAVMSGAFSWSSPLFRFRRRDDTWVRLSSHGYILRDDEGRPIRAVGSMVLVDDGAGPRPEVELLVLSDRQRRVLHLVREGRTNKEIGVDLGISEQAAKVRVRKLMQKFGAPNRAALAAIAAEHDVR